MSRSKMDKKQIFGWSMYDFANTIFSALFVTIYFPLLVVLKGGTPFHVGLAFSLSMILAGLTVPFLGAVADLTKRKKFLLFIFTLASCVFTFLTGFFALGFIILFGLFANYFYHASLDVYDSMLVDISNKKNIGKISGIGTAVGYLGTLLSIILAVIVGYFYGFESTKGIQIILVLTALFFFVFSLFTFILVKQPPKTKIIKIKKSHFKQAFKNVVETIKNIKKFKYIWIFFLASFLFADAAHTAIIFLYLYARDQLGLSLIQFFPIYFLMAITAFIGALIFGHFSDKIGHKKTLKIILLSWIFIVFILYLKTTYLTFIFVGLLGSALLGGIWTTVRPILVSLAPPEKITELFGYQGLTEKFSGVLGPLLFGLIATFIGFKHALVVVIAFFLLGLITLQFVKNKYD